MVRGCISEEKKRTREMWSQEQVELSKHQVSEDRLTWFVDKDTVRGLQRVAGVDVSFFPTPPHAVAAVVVLSFPELNVIYSRSATFETTQPYIATFLAYREVPAVHKLLTEVPSEMAPQVVLVDGNGIYHPRRCGYATHLGILTKLPTIGVAKTVLKVGDVGVRVADKIKKTLLAPGQWAPLMREALIKEVADKDDDDMEEPLAVLLRPTAAQQTLVVSSGHKICVETAVHLTKRLCLHSIPEPIRQADLRSRDAVRQWLAGKTVDELDLSDVPNIGVLPAKKSKSTWIVKAPPRTIHAANVEDEKTVSPQNKTVSPMQGMVSPREGMVSRTQEMASPKKKPQGPARKEAGSGKVTSARKVWKVKNVQPDDVPSRSRLDLEKPDVVLPAADEGNEIKHEVEVLTGVAPDEIMFGVDVFHKEVVGIATEAWRPETSLFVSDMHSPEVDVLSELEASMPIVCIEKSPAQAPFDTFPPLLSNSVVYSFHGLFVACGLALCLRKMA